jgi:hypothetical protein
MKAPPIDYIKGSKKWWITTEDCVVTLSNSDKVIIPKGFITDLATAPKILWGVFNPYGDFLASVILHDYLYVSKYKQDELGYDAARLMWDKEMLYLSIEINPYSIFNYIRYYMVRLLGGSIFKWWYKYTQKKLKRKKYEKLI